MLRAGGARQSRVPLSVHFSAALGSAVHALSDAGCALSVELGDAAHILGDAGCAFSVELSDAVRWRKFITEGTVKSLKPIREHFTDSILSFLRGDAEKGKVLERRIGGASLCAEGRDPDSFPASGMRWRFLLDLADQAVCYYLPSEMANAETIANVPPKLFLCLGFQKRCLQISVKEIPGIV